MRLDLHIHTVASDGAWTPEEVVEGALAGRLDVIAIADHDTAAGVEHAVRSAGGRNLEIIPATELSTTFEGRELHILGYFIDPSDPGLLAHQERAEGLRLARIEGMVGRLRREGVPVELDAVLRQAGPRRSMVGRPHLARAMVEAGHVSDVPEAFDRFIGDRHPAFIPTALASPVEAVEVIRGAGGIAVWAHPPGDLVEELLPYLRTAGLRGLEVYRPRSRPDQVRRLEHIARSADLLTSGGSDWHDPDRNEALGDFWVAAPDIGALLEAGGM